MFKLHLQHLKDIKSCVNTFGIIWFHGDGNIYHNESDSDFRKDFSNSSDGPQTYRVKFDKTSTIPTTMEELSDLLMKAKNAEAIEKSKPKAATGIKTFKSEPVEDKTAKEKK